MAFRVNDAEREALRGMQHIDQVLYLLGIRPFMDYSTRIAGESRRLSLQGFREVLEITESRGRSKERGAPSKWRILRCLERLENRGLIQRDADLVFALPLADAEVREKSFRTDYAPTKATDNAPDNAPGNDKYNSNISDTSAPDNAPDNAPPKSDNSHHLRSPGYSVSKDTGTDVPQDPAARMWRLWVELVGDTPANRRNLGKAIKEHSEEEVTEAVALTYAKRPADPVSYMRGCLKPKRRFVC